MNRRHYAKYAYTNRKKNSDTYVGYYIPHNGLIFAHVAVWIAEADERYRWFQCVSDARKFLSNHGARNFSPIMY